MFNPGDQIFAKQIENKKRYPGFDFSLIGDTDSVNEFIKQRCKYPDNFIKFIYCAYFLDDNPYFRLKLINPIYYRKVFNAKNIGNYNVLMAKQMKMSI